MPINLKTDPSSDYDDYYEKTKFQLTYRLSVAVAVILFILGISFYLLEQPVLLLNLCGLLSCLGFVVYMRITKKYKIAAYLFTLLGASLSILTLLLLPDSYHFVDPLWMLIVSLFAYFTLGKTVGNIILTVQFLSVSYYIVFFLNDSLKMIPSLTDGELYSLSLNAFLCAMVIAYLIHQFLKRNAYAANGYRKLTQELHLKNELVENQNREKTAMLKEIHHRVKNNLQVITSLLRLQSRDMKNPESVNHFKEAIGRISAMALIHNQMYQSKDLDRIHLESYLQSLSKNILSSYTLDIPVNISFNIQIQHTASNSIVPIALLFNELVSNSLKHAFSNKEEGEIKISLLEEGTNHFRFIYSDNGDWVEPIKMDSFGLELIETLAQQLNGSMVRSTEKGTQYEFILRIDEE